MLVKLTQGLSYHNQSKYSQTKALRSELLTKLLSRFLSWNKFFVIFEVQV